MTQEEREQERETGVTKSRIIGMDKKKKNTLSYCIPNFRKLLHEVPLCGEVL